MFFFILDLMQHYVSMKAGLWDFPIFFFFQVLREFINLSHDIY